METLKMIGLFLGIILLASAGLVAIIAVMSIPLWGAIYLIGEIIKAVV